MSQQVNALSPSRIILSALRKLGIRQQISNMPQQSTRTFLTSTPGSLDLRLFPGGILDIQRSHFPNIARRFPQESPAWFKISSGQFESCPQQQVNALSPSRIILSALRKLSILQQISNIPQQSIQTFLTSIPDSLDLRLFPGGIPDIQWSHFPSAPQINFPRRVRSEVPPGKWNPSPQQEAYPQ